MAATKNEPKVYEVQLQQKYWLKDTSKTKLLQLQAICLDKVTEQEHYYDTALHELAMTQTWLSQKNQQWHLIVASQKQETRGNASTTELSPKMWNTLHLDKTDASHVKLHTHILTKELPEDGLTGSANISKQDELHYHSKKATNAGTHMEHTSTYAELVTEREIITYLAHSLHIGLTKEEERNMTIKDFLQLAGVQHYASYHHTKQVTYTLYGIYTIIIQMDEKTSKESATILVDTDILNVDKCFEEIEKLASDLELQHQTP
ncbi:PREDICTED: uncharacterized protein LOC109293106 [Gavialis gangeticus]|uniref:uncharacterized protein LOC109293106 n=1 Tax=Gavialis gangeticus TaxID=94835 RepID=UPI00092F06FA|nr:PREDICTED: uncharacterized protein LOC109293106 [Gavialis gangeticus]